MNRLIFFALVMLFCDALEAQVKFPFTWSPTPTQFIKLNKEKFFTYQEYLELVQRDEIAFIATVDVKSSKVVSVEYTTTETQIQVMDYGRDLNPDLAKKVATLLQLNISIKLSNSSSVNTESARAVMSLFFTKKDRKRVKPW